MQVTQTKTFSVLLGPAVIIVCLLLLQFSFRWTAWALFLLLLVAYGYFLWRRNLRWMRLIFVAFLATVFLPVDVHAKKLSGSASIRAADYGYAAR